jgi:two-component system, NtrC family, sensor histidine kinase HydH
LIIAILYMKATTREPRSELYHRLKWLTFFRLLFTTLLLGGAAYIHSEGVSSFLTPPLVAIYSLTVGIFLLSIIYALLLNRLKSHQRFASFQVCGDTAIVSVMIYLTGGFSSVFPFLYLVVMIYSSMLIYRKGSLIMAALCSIQYGAMVDLEYYGLLKPFISTGLQVPMSDQWRYVILKILMISIGCFAVSFLSSLLAEQARKSRRELAVMEEQVRRVEKMATVGEMAAGLAHEIKNPLASLSGSIQLLREEVQFNGDHDRLMNIVLREANRLNSLLSNFLLFARPQARKLELIELKKALEDTVSLFEKNINCAGRITIDRAFIPASWVEMDPMHFHQVLWNLLLNAAEAIDGSGRIAISMLLSGSSNIRIEISDTGCGMSKEKIKLIFDPFYTTKAYGTGLGLSIVHRILETYGFWVTVDSVPDKGTTFTIHLMGSQPPAKRKIAGSPQP